MYQAIDKMPDSSRLWIYQSNRKLKADEAAQIENKARDFVSEWTAHKQNLNASVQVLHHSFLMLMVDESQTGASGCSIDSSVRFIKQLEQEFDLNFFDRLNFAFANEGSDIFFVKKAEIKEAFNKGKISAESFYFNNLVGTLGEFKSNWQQRFKDSWLYSVA